MLYVNSVLCKSCGSSDMCFEVFGVSLKPLGPVSFVWLDDEFYTGRMCCLWKVDFVWRSCQHISLD